MIMIPDLTENALDYADEQNPECDKGRYPSELSKVKEYSTYSHESS